MDQIKAAAKERGETVGGWCRVTLVEAATVEGQLQAIEHWEQAEASMPLPPDEEMLRRAREPDPDR